MVTPTEKAKRSEALYYDNHNITRRTLCDRVVNLESDMEEIKAENAKLRDENQSIGMAAYELGRKSMAGENAKLRELLGGVGYLLFALDVDYCVACPRDSNAHPCPVYTVKGGECLYKSDMRELGVEVDG